MTIRFRPRTRRSKKRFRNLGVDNKPTIVYSTTMTKYIAYLPRFGNFSKDLVVARKAIAGLDSEAVVLEAMNLEDVFAQLNHGSGSELEGYEGRSLSVGDAVCEADRLGRAWMVDSFGWTEI